MALTDTECRNAKCPEGRPYVRLADGGGLYLEVTATGSKLWRWKYRHAGKEKRLALGVYPVVPLASRPDAPTPGGILKGARQLRDEARALLSAGTDPGEARKDAKRVLLALADTAFEPVARTNFLSAPPGGPIFFRRGQHIAKKVSAREAASSDLAALSLIKPAEFVGSTQPPIRCQVR